MYMLCVVCICVGGDAGGWSQPQSVTVCIGNSILVMTKLSLCAFVVQCVGSTDLAAWSD